jgi:hypothetical protein
MTRRPVARTLTDMSDPSIRAFLAAACLVAATAGPALAQDAALPADASAWPAGLADSPPRTLAEIREELRSPEWGGAPGIVNIAAWAFAEGVQGPLTGEEPTLFAWVTTTATNSTFAIYRSSGTEGIAIHSWFAAPLDSIPAGAQIMGMVVEGCDTHATQEIRARLITLPSGASWLQSPLIQSGVGATPGCGLFGSSTNLQAQNIFVDKLANTYLVNVALGGNTTATQFRSVRVFYRLRVSPAPATARFTDVPTNHIFFQWIEALAASGVTGGCTSTPGGFCPNDPVTRGQMAVFLATALGLHFPN